MLGKVRWPRDMIISVDERSPLLHLLYDYAALRLENTRDIPPLISVPPPLNTPDESSALAQHRWESAWDSARRWYRTSSAGFPPAPAPYPEDDAPQRARGDEEARFRWFNDVAPVELTPPNKGPEWMCLDTLIPAWQEGLETILVLPYRGFSAERLSARVLLISPATRHSPSAFRAALTTPPAAGSPAPVSAL